MSEYLLDSCVLGFNLHIFGAFKDISGWAPTCDGVQLWQLYHADPLGYQVADTVSQFPTQSHYPDTELASPCPIIIMPSTRLSSDKSQFCKSTGF